MACRSFTKQLSGATGVALLLVAASLSQLPSTTRAIPVTDLESPWKPYDIHSSLIKHLFALDGTKDIANVTIFLPQLDALYAAAASYPRHDNATREFDQAIADALACMYEGGASGDQCMVGQNVSAEVAGVMKKIWKFQIVKQYIPPSVAMQKYSSIDNHWKLPTMHGQPLWMSYSPKYGGMWNISGLSPLQQASSLFPRSTIVNHYGHVVNDGSPYAAALVESGDVLFDSPSGRVVVYRSDAPYDIHSSLIKHLFALDGTKDIANVTILLPQLDALYAASVSYPMHDNATREFDQAIADALTFMFEGGLSGDDCHWVVGKNPSAAVAGAMKDIWKFQIVKQYIPPSVAMQKYASVDGHWELPTMHGQPLWMTYSPMYGGMWNISGMSPQQRSGSLFPMSKIVNRYGHVIDDGSPYAAALVESGDVLFDSPSGRVVVYRSDAVLIPPRMHALGAYAGTNAHASMHTHVGGRALTRVRARRMLL
ncbi:unnamed protein product [Closterium sp. Yama58-4]|nr:unnamed protein product [Closterium sp. Yama58-4]